MSAVLPYILESSLPTGGRNACRRTDYRPMAESADSKMTTLKALTMPKAQFRIIAFNATVPDIMAERAHAVTLVPDPDMADCLDSKLWHVRDAAFKDYVNILDGALAKYERNELPERRVMCTLEGAFVPMDPAWSLFNWEPTTDDLANHYDHDAVQNTKRAKT